MDNDTEFLYDTNKIHDSDERRQVLDKAWRYYHHENEHQVQGKSGFLSWVSWVS